MPSQWWMWHLFTPLELCVAFKTIAWDALWFMSWRESNGSCSPHTNMYLYMYIYNIQYMNMLRNSVYISVLHAGQGKPGTCHWVLPCQASLGVPNISKGSWPVKLETENILKKCPSSFGGHFKLRKQRENLHFGLGFFNSTTHRDYKRYPFTSTLDSRNDGLKVPTFAWGLRLEMCGHWMWSNLPRLLNVLGCYTPED